MGWREVEEAASTEFGGFGVLGRHLDGVKVAGPFTKQRSQAGD